MKTTIYQVDAFTEVAFKGNPSAVMISEENLSPELMQNIAMEMNLSETAFVNISENPFKIRFFTPTVEIPLCGHATLASAHILYEKKLTAEIETINFSAKGGNLTVSKGAKGIKMVFPKYEVKPMGENRKFSETIGFKPIEMYSCENNWIIAIAENENEISKANPNFNEMMKNGVGQLIITSLSDRKDIDFVVRCFAPAVGINEDPVTGSAQCGLVPVWNLRTGKTKFNVEQISQRKGELFVELVEDNIEITGKAITVFEAKLYL